MLPSQIERFFSRPLHGLLPISTPLPSAEALGYFHSVRFADGSLATPAQRSAFSKILSFGREKRTSTHMIILIAASCEHWLHRCRSELIPHPTR